MYLFLKMLDFWKWNKFSYLCEVQYIGWNKTGV